MQDAKSAEALLFDGIGRDSFGLQFIGECRAEHIVASLTLGRVAAGVIRGMWARSASSAMTGRFFERRADHGEGTIGVQQFGKSSRNES